MFKQGVELAVITWIVGDSLDGYSILEMVNKEHQADSITVEMVAGHSSMVPWAKVVRGDATVMVNLLQCQEVGLAGQKGEKQ